MYEILLPLHSLLRWLVLIGLIYALVRSILGVFNKSPFTRLDNFFRSFTSGMAHIQLIIGFLLYFKSPMMTYFRTNFREAKGIMELSFFGIYHALMMIIAIVLLTIGAAKAKRAKTDYDKHHHILLWFGIAFLFLLLAIPWQFSPFVARPHFRVF
jgi:uncharacterized membrane protein (DUF485 family)